MPYNLCEIFDATRVKLISILLEKEGLFSAASNHSVKDSDKAIDIRYYSLQDTVTARWSALLRCRTDEEFSDNSEETIAWSQVLQVLKCIGIFVFKSEKILLLFLRSRSAIWVRFYFEGAFFCNYYGCASFDRAFSLQTLIKFFSQHRS